MKSEVNTKKSDIRIIEVDLSKSYVTLFNSISDTIADLESLVKRLKDYQCLAEEVYITSGDEVNV